MYIIPSNCFNEQNLSTSVNKFFKTFQLSSILTICNCKKLKGINVMLLFSYILCVGSLSFKLILFSVDLAHEW